MHLSGSATASQIASGNIRGLAVTSPQRIKDFPDLPAIAEFYPGFEVTIWLGLFTTTGTSESVITRLRKAIDDTLADSDVSAKLRGFGMQPYATSRDAFLALIRHHYDKYGALVKELGVVIE